MSVKTQIAALNARLSDELCSRFVSASAAETTTALIDKLISAPRFLGKGTDLRPWQIYTTYPAYTAEDGTVTDPGISGTWNDDGSVTLSSLVPSPNAYPHAECTFETDPCVNVSGARLCIDAEHTAGFNMNVHYTDSDGVDRVATLSDMAAIETTDFPMGRTAMMVNFGAYVIEQGHINPPAVATKIDLLALATGQSANYVFDGGQVSFGANGDSSNYLMDFTINLNYTPYLYYSIAQSSSSGCTFGLYGTDPWYMFRDGSDSSAPTMNTNADDYTGPEKWIFGEQTGCIDLREYVDASHWAMFKVHELKLYGYDPSESANDTTATFNYLFLGSAPTGDVTDAWGEPATPTMPLRAAAAVGGQVTVKKIDYYVVGAEGDNVTIKQATLATEKTE